MLNRMSDLKSKAYMVTLILIATIYQRQGHVDKLSTFVKQATYVVLNKIQVNWDQVFI
jgi:hypothetical protein